MADFGRASTFLPTIKCSSCSREIEISQMGDHVCGGPTPGEPTPPLDRNGNFDRMPYQTQPSKSSGFLKPGRALPPRVDTSAANIPFLPQGQLTPVSSSPSRSVSPITPRSPYGRPLGPLRSATAPLQRRPPSPEILSSNLDCAFPPFPTSRNTQKRQQQQENGYGGNGFGGSALYAEPDQMYAPASPRIGSGKGVLQRMNTIAPGPFDVRRQQNSGADRLDQSHQRKVSGGGSTTGLPLERTQSDRATGHARSLTSSSNGSQSGVAPPRMPRQNGYGGFGPSIDAQPDREPSQVDMRSQTFPLQNESNDIRRRPSEPYTGPASREQSDRYIDNASTDSERFTNRSPPRGRMAKGSGPDLSRPLPPRGASLIRPRTATKPGDAPPVPEVNIDAEFGASNPYHTPTVSQSSSESGYSGHSKTSSRSSPPRPGTSQSRRKPSNVSHVDNLMADLQSSMAELQPRELPSDVSPPRKRGPTPAPLEPVPKFGPLFVSPESPMDPSMIDGRLSPLPLSKPSRAQTPLLDPRERSPPRAAIPQADLREKSPARRPSRPTTAKGNCKGCGEAIKGKSVSSADGRLTGRYHKSCFVCKTCLEPFQTATFYVIEDAPYCERHYHKLNGSVCNSCDKGIEGQYLESESKQKFHPECLKCSDCRRNLRNDYFEMNGRVYCERDAFRRAQQGRHLGLPGGGTNRMERRTTRLMMM